MRWHPHRFSDKSRSQRTPQSTAHLIPGLTIFRMHAMLCGSGHTRSAQGHRSFASRTSSDGAANCAIEASRRAPSNPRKFQYCTSGPARVYRSCIDLWACDRLVWAGAMSQLDPSRCWCNQPLSAKLDLHRPSPATPVGSRVYQTATRPADAQPSICRVWPLMNAAPSDSRKAMVAAINRAQPVERVRHTQGSTWPIQNGPRSETQLWPVRWA